MGRVKLLYELVQFSMGAGGSEWADAYSWLAFGGNRLVLYSHLLDLESQQQNTNLFMYGVLQE